MIDIREIQVGDYLQNTNGNVGKVVGIELYDGAIDEYDVAMRYSDNSTCYTSPKLLQPIPITPEILEKNGFSRNGLDIAVFDRKGGDDFVGAANLQSVHELQHALRICGISKEIVL